MIPAGCCSRSDLQVRFPAILVGAVLPFKSRDPFCLGVQRQATPMIVSVIKICGTSHTLLGQRVDACILSHLTEMGATQV